jgi:UTP--glucose-1-phosphate uridylyltransferase
MTRARVAIVPAAGLGTRMRPATHAVPKELLPVGGRPAIDWILTEAWSSGIEHVIVVTSPRKWMIDEYLECHDPICGTPEPSGGIERPLQISCVEQSEPRGLGDAIRRGAAVVPGVPIAVLLPDELMLGGALLLSSMLGHHEHTGSSIVSLAEVPTDEIESYGCARIGRPVDGGVAVTGCVEKPASNEAPSRFALCGRYVLEPCVVAHLGLLGADGSGEIPLTPALDRAGRRGELLGCAVTPSDGRVDVGNWSGWLDANRFAFAPSGERPLLAGRVGAA